MTNTEMHAKGGFSVSILEESFAIIAPQAELLGAMYCARLLKRFPAFRAMFAGSDTSSLQVKIRMVIQMLIANLRNPDVLLPALREMGRRYETYGVVPGQYMVATDLLLSVLAEIAGDSWTDQVRLAWIAALALVADTMVGAYTGIAMPANEDVAAIAPGGAERRAANRPWAAQNVIWIGDAKSLRMGRQIRAGHGHLS